MEFNSFVVSIANANLNVKFTLILLSESITWREALAQRSLQLSLHVVMKSNSYKCDLFHACSTTTMLDTGPPQGWRGGVGQSPASRGTGHCQRTTTERAHCATRWLLPGRVCTQTPHTSGLSGYLLSMDQ